MKDAYPKLRIQLEVDLSTAVEARLMEGQLDLTLQTGPFKTKSFSNEALGQELYCWAANTELSLHEIQSDWLPDPLLFPAHYAPTRSARYVEKAAQIAKSAMQQQ